MTELKGMVKIGNELRSAAKSEKAKGKLEINRHSKELIEELKEEELLN